MSPDEEIVYDFTTELLRNKRVSDATFDRADRRFGKKGVVDMAGIGGYYTVLAMEFNVARYQFFGEPRPSRVSNLIPGRGESEGGRRRGRRAGSFSDAGGAVLIRERRLVGIAVDPSRRRSVVSPHRLPLAHAGLVDRLSVLRDVGILRGHRPHRRARHYGYAVF